MLLLDHKGGVMLVCGAEDHEISKQLILFLHF